MDGATNIQRRSGSRGRRGASYWGLRGDLVEEEIIWLPWLESESGGVAVFVCVEK